MQQRNLNFKTKIFEWELAGQYNFFSFNEKWWTPYVFLGFGLFHFNPYTQDAKWYQGLPGSVEYRGQGLFPGEEL